MGIADVKDKAVRFYAVMHFYYSIYDGATDKAKVKRQFELMLDRIAEEMKQ